VYVTLPLGADGLTEELSVVVVGEGAGGVAIANAVTLLPLATNRSPPAALGDVKWLKAPRFASKLVAPVVGFRPYRWPLFQPADQTRPPATIGGPIAPELIVQPGRGVRLGVMAFSERACTPSLQVT
jgi:hypothetical protein